MTDTERKLAGDKVLEKFAAGFDKFMAESPIVDRTTPVFFAPATDCVPKAPAGKPCVYVVGTIETEVVGGPGPDIDYVFRPCPEAPLFKSRYAAKAWSRRHPDTVVGSQEIR